MGGEGWVPRGTKYVERFGEDIVVDESSVDGEQTHQEDDVTTIKYRTKHLQGWERI